MIKNRISIQDKKQNCPLYPSSNSIEKFSKICWIFWIINKRYLIVCRLNSTNNLAYMLCKTAVLQSGTKNYRYLRKNSMKKGTLLYWSTPCGIENKNTVPILQQNISYNDYRIDYLLKSSS